MTAEKTDKTWVRELTENACFRMDESYRMITICLKQLELEDIWHKPNEASNSMGNIILHLCGNIRQYVISSMGGKKDIRERDLEFTEKPLFSADILLEKLQSTIAEAKAVFSGCSAEELMRIRKVQGFTLSGIGVLLHVVEHLSYHTGQIAYWTKVIQGADLKFYKGVDLDIKNELD